MPQAQLSQWAQDNAPRPDLAAVELGDEDQKAPRGGVDVGGVGGDGGGESVVVHGGEFVGGDGMNGDHGTENSLKK